MGLAFGVTIGFSRLGSVLNFFITHNFEQAYGLQWTLWGGRSAARALTEERHVQIHTRGFDLQVRFCAFFPLELPS